VAGSEVVGGSELPRGASAGAGAELALAAALLLRGWTIGAAVASPIGLGAVLVVAAEMGLVVLVFELGVVPAPA
jgi:hypothetical protein